MNGFADAVRASSRIGRGMCPHESESEVPCPGTVLAVYYVAKSSDGLDEQQGGSGQVGDDTDGVSPPERVERSCGESAHYPAPQTDAPSPDSDYLTRVRLVEAPVVDDVDQSRADDAADYRPYRYRVDVVWVYASRGRPPSHQVDGGSYGYQAEQPMPAQNQRPGRYDVWAYRYVDHESRLTRVFPECGTPKRRVIELAYDTDRRRQRGNERRGRRLRSLLDGRARCVSQYAGGLQK